MLTITEITALRARLAKWRRENRIALVPTMGNLHAGHVSLIEHARARAERVVVSIFVNPLQFDRVEDLVAYPRTLEDDCRQLQALDVDVAFIPAMDTVYPRGTEHATRVEVPQLSSLLEGASRPGHFVGVATVVAKLFNITQPDLALFGEKDYQQLLIVRRLVADLNVPVEIVCVPTVREPNGLAMSSRNRNLTPDERERASGLYATLRHVATRLESGEREFAALEQNAERMLQESGFRPDYVSIRRAQDLAPAAAHDRDVVVLGAAWLGRTRLIDNHRVALMDYR